jgi:hypothetical protein
MCYSGTRGQSLKTQSLQGDGMNQSTNRAESPLKTPAPQRVSGIAVRLPSEIAVRPT